MRVKSELWVRAYLRRCYAENVPAAIVRHGDDAAGAIFICVHLLDGTVRLYGPAPAGFAGSENERRWVRLLGSEPVPKATAEDYLVRQWQFDPDLWIVEIEDRAGRHLLGDDAID
ncbi:MAG TPA: DUF1491 family protein [Methyloceanibacter sp.]|nr:DUF1491 family protein [Methyloceanibacter sp.]